MRVGPVDLSERVLVVAEVGNNHEGSLELALELVGLAAQAGVDAVKFQTMEPARLVSRDQAARLAQLSRLCLPRQAFPILAAEAQRQGLIFLSTPFDPQSLAQLAPLMPAVKIASGDNNHWALLESAALTGKPILLSTGLADLAQVRASRDFIHGVWSRAGLAGQLALLHCVCAYPTPPEQAGLLAIPELAGLGATPGYSDHTLGVEAAVLAVALGARIVEKHFTLRHDYSDFRDHQLSADPAEMADMVARIRRAEAMLGRPEKTPAPCEDGNAVAARRSLAAGRDLPAGHVLDRTDLDWLRPGGGLAPGQERLALGRTLRRGLAAGQRITLADLA